jgi:hypothetical protein
VLGGVVGALDEAEDRTVLVVQGGVSEQVGTIALEVLEDDLLGGWLSLLGGDGRQPPLEVCLVALDCRLDFLQPAELQRRDLVLDLAYQPALSPRTSVGLCDGSAASRAPATARANPSSRIR